MREVYPPKVSVIVPIYNAEKYIHQCINSILEQTFVNFELLLINDGSSDNCGIICDQYAANDSRVRVCHQENSGVSVSRNKGMQISCAEYLIFIDSDDFIDRNYLCQMMDVVNNNPNLSIVISGYKRVKQDSAIEYNFGGSRNISKSVFWENYFSNAINISIWGKLLRSKDVSLIQFAKDISYGEDALFLFDFIQNCSSEIYILDNSGYNYRDISLGLSRNKSMQSFISRSKFINLIYMRTQQLCCMKDSLNLLIKTFILKQIIGFILLDILVGYKLRFLIMRECYNYINDKQILNGLNYKTSFMYFYITKIMSRR